MVKRALMGLHGRLPRRLREHVLFLCRHGYPPDFRHPRTYSEKIIRRKRHWTHELFVRCSDKALVKEYVAERVGREVVIASYFTGDRLDVQTVRECLDAYGGAVLKANHNSGPVYILDAGADVNDIESAVRNVNAQLACDYGRRSGETWYSRIKPQVLIERRLLSPDGGDIPDFKFHVFTDGAKQRVILHVDFDRYGNHNRSWFTESLEWLPFSVLYPCIRTRIDRPRNYDKMLSIAKELAKPFSYVRVDLYNIDGAVYCGELTFAPGSGFSPFTPRAADKWLGKLWTGDVRM